MLYKYVVDKLKSIKGMDSYSDSTSLPDGVVKLVQNMVPDEATLTTRQGWAKYNTIELTGSSGVYGNAIYQPTSALTLELAVSNGTLYSGDAGTFTSRQTGFNATNLCTIVQFDDTAIVCDQANKMIAYKYGDTPYTVGINSPKDYKIIDDFENATDWTCANGSAANDTLHYIYGTQCVKFTSTSGGTMTAYKTFTAKDLTAHTDTSTSSTSDYISLFLIRGVYANFDACHLDLGDNTFTNYYRITLSGLAQWTATSAPNVAFEFKIRKSAFSTVNAPAWSAIAGVRFTLDAAAGVVAETTCDYLRLEKTGPIAADSGVAGNPDGDYYYKVTYITTEGWESDASVTSNYPDEITVVTNQITLTVIPVPGSTRIAQKKIYRMGGTSAEWRLLTILYDSSTTTYTDNTADADLGDIYTEVEGYPYTPKTVTVHNNKVVIANLTDTDGTTYPSAIMVSEESNFNVYDHLNFFEIEADYGGIKWLYSAMDFVYVGKADSIWKFDADDLTIPPRCLSRIYSGVGPLAVTQGENELYFMDKTGVISWNGSFFERVSDPDPERGRLSSVKNYIDNIPVAYIGLTWMLYRNKTLFVGVTATGGTYPTLVLAYHVPKKFWYVISGWSARCGYVYTNTLHLGHATTGYVYNCFSGDDDAGTDITSIVQTADSDFNYPELRKDYGKIFLHGNKETSTNVTLTIEPYIDGVDSGVDLDTSETILTSTTHNRLEVAVPQLTYHGTYLSLKITATERWNLKSLVSRVRIEAET